MTAGKSSVRGRLDLKLSSPIGIGGDIAADDVDAAAVAAMLLGLPSAAPSAGETWSPEPIGAGGFAAVNGTVNFKFDRAALTPSLIARDLKGVVQFQPPRDRIERHRRQASPADASPANCTFRHDAQASPPEAMSSLPTRMPARFSAPARMPSTAC